MDEIERLNQDKYFGALYNVEEEQRKLENSARLTGYEEGKEEGIVLGLEQGIEQGSLSTKQEIAKSLFERKMSIDEIKNIVGLSIEELEEICQ